MAKEWLKRLSVDFPVEDYKRLRERLRGTFMGAFVRKCAIDKLNAIGAQEPRDDVEGDHAESKRGATMSNPTLQKLRASEFKKRGMLPVSRWAAGVYVWYVLKPKRVTLRVGCSFRLGSRIKEYFRQQTQGDPIERMKGWLKRHGYSYSDVFLDVWVTEGLATLERRLIDKLKPMFNVLTGIRSRIRVPRWRTDWDEKLAKSGRGSTRAL